MSYASDKAQKAVEIKRQGNNCTQAVVQALRKENDPDEKTLGMIAKGFGAGMGCLEATCGALVGSVMMAGLHNDSTRPMPLVSRSILQKFEEYSGATICKELKAAADGVPLCACEDCVRNAVRAYEEVMEPENTAA